jgi:hypothetical protein
MQVPDNIAYYYSSSWISEDVRDMVMVRGSHIDRVACCGIRLLALHARD